MLTETIHAQRAPQHVFSGNVRNFGQPLNDGFVRITIGPGTGIRAFQEGYGDIRQGRYKIAVVEPAGGNYSGLMLRFIVGYQGREYERSGEVRWGAGGITELNFDIEGWQWHQAQPQRVGGQPGGDDFGRQMQEDAEKMRHEQMGMEQERREREDEERREQNRREEERREREGEERRDMERGRMESEEEMRREQMERETEMREREGEERRGMEREQMERETEMREREGEERRGMERERMEADEEMRREEMERQQRMDEQRMEMERERMEREDERRREESELRLEMERERMERRPAGVQPVAGERSKSGPSRGLFSNRKAGEATSGIDNIMDPTTLTIIGIALTVLTTGMTLFKGD
jgi:hypothetical protein